MKKLILVFVFFSALVKGQNPNVQWASSIGGVSSSDESRSYSVKVDAAGNVYTTGYYTGTVDFDPGIGVYNLTSSNANDAIFISKLDANGNFVWAKSLTGVSWSSGGRGYSIALDISGNAYITGIFNDTLDFDPSVGVYNLSSSGIGDIFVSKLDASGNFVWAKNMGGSGAGAYGNSICLDLLGNVLLTGNFNNTIDFDPGSGVYNLTPSSGNIFVCKLDGAGNFVWAGNMGNGYGRALSVDATGNVYTTGGYTGGSTDFDPGPGVYNMPCGGGPLIYVSKLDANGNFVWAKCFGVGNAGNCNAQAITIDSGKNILITGTFDNTMVDFDPGSGTFNLSSTGSRDVFISKLDSNGIFVWAKSIGSTTLDDVFSIVVDNYKNVYTCGYNLGTADFDPNIGVVNRPSGMFISKLDSLGNFAWVHNTLSTPPIPFAFGITLDNNLNVYTAGMYNGTKFFGVFSLTGLGVNNTFVLKMCQIPPSPISTTSFSNQMICNGGSATLSAISTGTINWFSTPTSTTSLGSGTVFITPTLSVGTYTYYTETNNPCGVNIVRTPITITVNPNPIITVNSGTVCNGSSFPITANGASTYTFSGGSAIVSPSINTTYSVIGTSSLGCVSSNTAVSSITVIATPTITVNTGTICSGNTFTIIPGGATSYTYSSGSNTVSPLSTSNFTVIGTNTVGCIASVINTVVVNPTPTLSTNSGSICNGASFTINPSGASTYTFTSGSAVVNPTINSTYSVTGTSSLGCVGSNTAVSSVTVNALPIISATNGTICSGDSFTITPSGASTYTFSSGSAVVSPTVNSTYSVTGTSSLGCVGSNTAINSVTVNALPFISATNGTICSGSNFTITPSGASTYTFSSGTAVVSPTINSTYSVTGTSSLGCVGSNTAVSNVTVNVLPVISVSSGSICSSESYTINPSGAVTYTISGGSAIVSPTISTTYTVAGTGINSCINSQTLSVGVNTSCVWPGDANSDGIADNLDILELGLHYTSTGGTRIVTSNLWQAFDAPNWVGTITSGKNLHHSDCNGDGIIDQNDTLAVFINYNSTHPFKQSNLTYTNSQISLVPDQASVYNGQWGTASIFLGDASNPINNINGVAYTLTYDNSLIEPDSVWLEYPTSFLNATNTNLHFRKRDFTNGALYTATTHTNNTNVSGNGKIAILHYKILSSLTTTNVLNIGITQANQSDASGLITPLTSGSGSLLAIGNAVGIKENTFANSIFISPNPNSGIFNIHISTPLNVTENNNIQITNTLGQIVYQSAITNQQSSINIQQLNNGIYFVKVLEGNKVIATQKIINE